MAMLIRATCQLPMLKMLCLPSLFLKRSSHGICWGCEMAA